MPVVFVGGEDELRATYCGQAELVEKDFQSFQSHSLSQYFSEKMSAEIMHELKEEAHFARPYYTIEKLTSYVRSNPRNAVFEFTSLDDVVEDRSRILLQLENDIQIRADNVILATGAWKKFEINRSRIKKIVSLHFNLVPDNKDAALFFVENDAFMLPLSNRNHWLFSFPSREWDCNISTNSRISNDDMRVANSILDIYLPSIKNRKCGGRVGYDEYSPQGELEINKVAQKIYQISGASGSGYRLSYGLGDVILEKMGFE